MYRINILLKICVKLEKNGIFFIISCVYSTTIIQ